MGWPLPPCQPKYTVLSEPTATEGSLSPEALPGIACIVQVRPLSREETTAAFPLPQFLLGTYAVPSGPTLMCPCRPPQSAKRVNRHGRAISKAAVQADGAGSINHILRAVINGVLISNGRRQLWNQAGSERAAANGLMIDSSGAPHPTAGV